MADLNQIKLTECERKLRVAAHQLLIAEEALDKILTDKLMHYHRLVDEHRGIAKAAKAEIGDSKDAL